MRTFIRFWYGLLFSNFSTHSVQTDTEIQIDSLKLHLRKTIKKI